MFERIRTLGWDVLLGVLAIAAVLLAIPLVRSDIGRLIHLPEPLYLIFAVVGAVLAAVGLLGITVLLLGLALGRPSTWCESRPVSRRDVQRVFELMRRFFGDETPSITRMLEWQRRNKTVLTAVYIKTLRGGRTRPKLVGVYKILPLTPQAVELLESERKTGATLSARDIATESDQLAGFYIGDVVASTREGKAEVIRQLKQRVRGQLRPGVSVYTRPLTSDGARLVRKYNFIPIMDGLAPGSMGRIHKLIAPRVPRAD